MHQSLLVTLACIGCTLAGFMLAIVIPPRIVFQGDVSVFAVVCMLLTCIFLALIALESARSESAIRAWLKSLNGTQI
jgi:hypothetical protein